MKTRAAVSLGCALIGVFFFVPAIAALILGHAVRRDARRSGQRQGVAMATTALVIGYLYLASVGLALVFALSLITRAVLGHSA